jgi:hypothetical protein
MAGVRIISFALGFMAILDISVMLGKLNLVQGSMLNLLIHFDIDIGE